MERMISHEEVQELLGAYALDAVDADEKALRRVPPGPLSPLPRRAPQPPGGGRVARLRRAGSAARPVGSGGRGINDAGPGVARPNPATGPGPARRPADASLAGALGC